MEIPSTVNAVCEPLGVNSVGKRDKHASTCMKLRSETQGLCTGCRPKPERKFDVFDVAVIRGVLSSKNDNHFVQKVTDFVGISVDLLDEARLVQEVRGPYTLHGWLEFRVARLQTFEA